MNTQSERSRELNLGRGFLPSLYAGNARSVFVRNMVGAKSSGWVVILSGFFEPVLYLLAMGIGLGSLIGDIQTGSGEISYAAYIAPALLAVSAMNGAVYDSTWNVFFKLHFGKLYEGMLYTPLGPFDIALGEMMYAMLRGLMYASGFLVVMQIFGLNGGWQVLLALPAVVLIALAFASIGMGITSFMKTFQQMDWINFLLLPMFLFSGTFYPIEIYPETVQWIVQALPLWHAVELLRTLVTIGVDPALVGHILYFLGMILLGLFFTTTRLKKLFLT